jgi:hypothetical protein
MMYAYKVTLFFDIYIYIYTEYTYVLIKTHIYVYISFFLLHFILVTYFHTTYNIVSKRTSTIFIGLCLYSF